MFSAVVFCLLFLLGQSSAEFLFTCSGEYLDLRQSVVSFKQMCSDLLVEKDPLLFPLEPKLCRTLWSVDMMHVVGVSVGLLWERPAAMILRHTCLRKAAPAECKGYRSCCRGFRPSVLTLYCSQKPAYGEGQGRELVPAPSFISESRVCTHHCPGNL